MLLVADWASSIWSLLQIEHLLLQLSEVMVVDLAPLAVCRRLLRMTLYVLLDILHGQSGVGIGVDLQMLRLMHLLLLAGRECGSWSDLHRRT